MFTELVFVSTPLGVHCVVSEPLIYSVGTQVVLQKDTCLANRQVAHPAGSVASQFKKMQADLRNQGRVKWKHVMHLIRLLLSGIDALREGKITVAVGEQRETLLAIKRGEVAFDEADARRKRLQIEFERAFQQTHLPDRPDYERVNAFLIRARRLATQKELP